MRRNVDDYSDAGPNQGGAFLNLYRDTSQQQMYILDRQGNVLDQNRSGRRFAGERSEESLGHRFETLGCQGGVKRVNELLSAGLKIGLARGEFSFGQGDGQRVFQGTLRGGAQDDMSGAELFVLELVEVTDFVMGISQLEAERKFLTLFLDGTEHTMGVITRTGQLVYLNRRAKGFMNLPEGADLRSVSLWRCPCFVQSTGTRDRLRDAVERAGRGEVLVFEEMCLGPDGELFSMECSLRPVSLPGDPTALLLFEAGDMSRQKNSLEERVHIERRFLQQQKMKSLTDLAVGVAHDFNNLLTGILGNACLIMTESRDTEVHAMSREIEKASLKAADICRHMLAFSGVSYAPREKNDLATFLEHNRHRWQRELGEKITLDLELQTIGETMVITADWNLMRIVVLHLLANARESLESEGVDTSHPTVVLSAGRDPAGKERVWLEVRDNGPGMAAETMARACEPFFSTKFLGRGLGLAAASGFVRSHGGEISLISHPGHQTVVHLWLPMDGSTEGSADGLLHETGAGKVLVVDDQSMDRRVVAEYLALLGYPVVEAASGGEALQRLAGDPGLALGVLDLRLPGMDGLQLGEVIQEMRPGFPLILMSGSTERMPDATLEADHWVGFIAKPLAFGTLQNMVHRVLDPVQSASKRMG